MFLSLWGTESDPRPEAGPTSGANHSCSRTRTPGQGRPDRNRTRVVDQGTAGCASVAQSRLGIGSGYRGRRRRLVPAVRAQ